MGGTGIVGRLKKRIFTTVDTEDTEEKRGE
jgi:hypothetical protein